MDRLIKNLSEIQKTRIARLKQEASPTSMVRSFGLVDDKIAEAEFFLNKLSESRADFFEARCYASAFASSMRSVTFALQSVLGRSPDFPGWYQPHQQRLRQDPLARFFHEFRRVSQHVGVNPVSGGTFTPGKSANYYFMPTPDLPEVPEMDVKSACRSYFVMLLELVYECYIRFGSTIDPQQYFTEGHFSSLGKTVEDAEEELGFPRGWTDIGDPRALPHRWKLLRDRAAGESHIAHLFEEYLGKRLPRPRDPEPYAPKRSKKKGWVYVPRNGD